MELLKTSFQVETAALKFSLKSTWWGQIEIFPPNQVQSWAHLFPSHSIGRLGGHFCIVHHDGNAFICLFRISNWYYQPEISWTEYENWQSSGPGSTFLITFLSLFSYWQLTWFSFSVVPQLDFSSLIGFFTANDAAGVKLKLLAPSNDSSVSWQMPFGPQSTAHVLISQLFPLQPALQEQKPDGKQDLAFTRFIQEQRLQSGPSKPVLHWHTPLNVIYSLRLEHW